MRTSPRKLLPPQPNSRLGKVFYKCGNRWVDKITESVHKSTYVLRSAGRAFQGGPAEPNPVVGVGRRLPGPVTVLSELTGGRPGYSQDRNARESSARARLRRLGLELAREYHAGHHEDDYGEAERGQEHVHSNLQGRHPRIAAVVANSYAASNAAWKFRSLTTSRFLSDFIYFVFCTQTTRSHHHAVAA